MNGHPIGTDHISPENQGFYSKLERHIQYMAAGKNTEQCGIIVTGPIGTGKSYLIEQFLFQFKTDQYLILNIKHHQQRKSIPYAGLKIGIADFLRNVYNEMDRDSFNTFSSGLRNKLGAYFQLLHDYIPELNLLKGTEFKNPSSPNPKIENQLYRLFKIFFEFLSDFFNKPVLFFTDDLQWMDGSSVNLLYYLVTSLPPQKMIWIGSSRDSKENMLRVNQLIESLKYDNKHIKVIPLAGFSQDQTLHFLEKTLGGPIDLSLSQICHQLSAGTPSYLQVLVDSLKNAKLISKKAAFWQGNLNQIHQQYQGRNSQNILSSRLDKLSAPSLELLYIMSSMSNFKKETLLKLLSKEEKNLAAAIQETTDAGLTEFHEGKLRFTETYMAEVIYDRIPQTEKSNIHYKIAKETIAVPQENSDHTQIVIAAQHFNQALDKVKKQGETLLCAKINLEAGRIQQKDHAYEQARHFLKVSADLFNELPWETIKDQLWETWMERAKVEYYMGEYDLAEIFLDHLLERLLDPLKRAEAFVLKITINNHLGRYRKVLKILGEILLELDVSLPKDDATFKTEIESLTKDLGRKDVPSTDKNTNLFQKQNAILKLLYVGGMALHHTSDIMMTWAALQIIHRSQGSQNPAVKAIGHVSYGRMNIIAGDIEKGYEFGHRGLATNQELNDLEYRCRVYGVFAFYIQPWKKSFNQSRNLLTEGMKAGRLSGDLIGLYILKTHLFNLHLLSGAPIKSLLGYEFEESYPGKELTYYITHYQKSLIQYLCGDNAFFSIPRQQPSWLAAKLTIQEERFYRNYVWARYYFLFGHYDQALACTRDARKNQKLQEGSPLVPANLVLLFLSISQNWNNFPSHAQPNLLEELKLILSAMEQWNIHAPENYASTYHLLNAEYGRLKHIEKESIHADYEQAIEKAGTNHYERALAHELLGKHLLSLNELNNASEQLLMAIQAYQQWEGKAKANQLIQQYSFLLNEQMVQMPEQDIETLLRELSGELESKPLSKKLMVMLLRLSGSTKTVIQWIEKSGEVIHQTAHSLLPLTGNPVAAADQTPSGLMLMAHRTQSLLLMNELESENSFSEVKELRKQSVQSMMILPININGYLSMVVYLENRFIKNIYQEAAIKWIRIVANQGGMVIENARTHEKTLKLNEEIRREMEEKERLSSMIENQKNNHLRDIIQTQEDERKRIAGDLHDSLGSLLSTIKMRFHSLQENTHNERYKDTLDKMDEAIEEVRRIAHNMSPVSLRRFGLASALQTLIEEINLNDQMEAHLQVLGLEERLPEQIELTIYRICQELVNNSIKHAKATNIQLQLINHLDSINITVEDNGIGMDPQKQNSGFGLHGIEAKVQMLNGQFNIESQPGKGFLAVIDIPINTA
ncbi:AAA family ATPase [Echinicola marina]|uniref:AAA family ATPase n=1 Tax=Echinicola marina TaxID=2859768 RepID=UPI001CF6A6BD|nr:AAA family ATPase [Echinicola marina]UCS95332.1 AAA family ATPase [Echinicola marina]